MIRRASEYLQAQIALNRLELGLAALVVRVPDCPYLTELTQYYRRSIDALHAEIREWEAKDVYASLERSVSLARPECGTS